MSLQCGQSPTDAQIQCLNIKRPHSWGVLHSYHKRSLSSDRRAANFSRTNGSVDDSEVPDKESMSLRKVEWQVETPPPGLAGIQGHP